METTPQALELLHSNPFISDSYHKPVWVEVEGKAVCAICGRLKDADTGKT